ncbi:19240_t:CDS:1 [Funneliformis geosporum]|nr:19240_t:CDS:1 [Funneliformis geosporum]
MDYANEGSLKNFLSKIVKFNWHTRLNLLNDIIAGLEKIHDTNLVHCNLHDGNILTKRIRNNYNGLDLFQNFVDDLRSCQPFEYHPSASSNNESIYGVLPFIAPEILGGEPYTPESDIYSCSMIMWELASGISPFYGREHDTQLMLSIYKGERPGIIQKTPQCYVDLMKACWDSDPSERPTATEISTIVQNWIYYTLKYYEAESPLDIKQEIDRKLIKENIDQVIEEIDDVQLQNDTIEFWNADKDLTQCF